MQQFGAPMFYKVVHWQKLGEMENEYILGNFIILAIFVPKIIKVSWSYYDKNNFNCFFWDMV